MVTCNLAKVESRVRFPTVAPNIKRQIWLVKVLCMMVGNKKRLLSSPSHKNQKGRNVNEIIKELERIARDCRLQERIETQMQIRQLIERVRNGNGSR